MWTDTLRDPGLPCRVRDRFLHDGFVQMRPRRWPPSRIRTHPRRGKDELPTPFYGCVRVFAVAREWKHDPPQPSCEIGFLLSLHKLEMVNQRLDDGGWQYRWPVLLA